MEQFFQRVKSVFSAGMVSVSIGGFQYKKITGAGWVWTRWHEPVTQFFAPMWVIFIPAFERL